MVVFKAAKAVLTVFITPATFGTIVIIVPTADTTFPMTISTGPSAAAILFFRLSTSQITVFTQIS